MKLLIGLCCVLFSCSPQSKISKDKLSYSLTLNEDRSEIDVELTYIRISIEDTLILLLPTHFDRRKRSNQLIPKDIRLMSSEGKLQSSTLDNMFYIGQESEIKITYTIPSFSTDTTFLSCDGEDYFFPVINKKFFHFYGDKSLIVFNTGKSKFDVQFKWENFPKEWVLANDFGVTAKNDLERIQEKSDIVLSDLRSITFFGGEYRQHVFNTNGINFHSFIFGDFNYQDQDLIDMMKTVSEAEMNAFGDFPNDKEYIISFTQKGDRCGSLHGRNTTNAFALYFSGKFKSKHIPLLYDMVFTHEFTHTWIGSNLLKNNDNWVSMRWFTEGFTDYYTFKINQKAGIISADKALANLNQAIQKYYQSPYKNISLEEFQNTYRFDDRIERLAYEKGASFAHFLNEFIKKESKQNYNLDSLMAKLFSKKGKDYIKGNLTIESLNELSESELNMSLKTVLKDYIIDGKSIPITAKEIEMKTVKSFRFGFDFLGSFQSDFIQGVDSKSYAYKNGLRNGQVFKSVKQIAHSPTDDMILIVSENGVEKRITFKVIGDEIEIPQILRF